MTCPVCTMDNTTSSRFCWKCGTNLSNPPTLMKQVPWIVVVSVVALVVVIAVLAIMMGSR